MKKFLFLVIGIFVSIFVLHGQAKVAEINVNPEFSKQSESAAYFNKDSSLYFINLQTNSKITRYVYDSSFHLKEFYTFPTDQFTLDKKKISIPLFAAEMLINGREFELYANKEKILVIEPDFTIKKDKIVYEYKLKQSAKDEKILGIMPLKKGLRILSFSNKLDKFFLYFWRPDGKTDKSEILLPKSSLSDEEKKKYPKEAEIKYKKAFNSLNVSPANSTSIISPAEANGLYYTDEKIYLLSQSSFWMGYNLLEIDPENNSAISSNFFINDIKENTSVDNNNNRKIPYAVIAGKTLIIRNSSNSVFEYHFYDLETKQKIKEFSATADESLHKLFHSELRQKGTWASRTEEKKLDNEKAFLRKMILGKGFMTFSHETNDSITITTGSLILTDGIEGALVSMATGMLGYMANITLGQIQIIPYLQLYRNKLLYTHTRFSKTSFELSKNSSVKGVLDNLVDDFDRKDIVSSSSFMIKKGEDYYLSIFNTETRKFEIYKLWND